MNSRQEVAPNGHLQVIGGRGNRRWRAFWWDADGKHSRVLGKAWARSSGRRTSRGAVIWHAGDGAKPDSSYMTPQEAEAELRRLLEHDAVKRPTPRSARGAPVTFADAAEAWLVHGERKRNLKRSTLKDYRQVLDAYLLPALEDAGTAETRYGRARFASTPLRDLRPAQVRLGMTSCPTGARPKSCQTRSLMSSVLKLSTKLSARALSNASPIDPTDASTLWSSRTCP